MSGRERAIGRCWLACLAALAALCGCGDGGQQGLSKSERARVENLAAELKELTAGHEYEFETADDDFAIEEITDIVLEFPTLVIEATDFTIGDVAQARAPLADIRVAVGSMDGGAELSRIKLECAQGDSCISLKYAGPGDAIRKGLGMPNAETVRFFVFGCEATRCEKIAAGLEELAALAGATQPAAPEDASPDRNSPARSAADIVLAINGLGERLEYGRDVVDSTGNPARYDVSMYIAAGLDPQKGALQMVKSGTASVFWRNTGERQSRRFNQTATIPLAKVGAARSSETVGALTAPTASGAPAGEAIYWALFKCDDGAGCIRWDNGDGSAPTAWDHFPWECAGSRCAALVEEFADLEALFEGKGDGAPLQTPPQQATPNFPPTDSAPARPVSRQVTSAINRANERVDRDAAPLPGLLPTQGLAALGDGRIALHTDSCAADRKGCGANAITDNEVVVAFAAGDINGSSIAMQGNAVIFSCHPAAGACIRSPDGRLQFAGYGLPCKDRTECNRLVIDLSSLLDFAAQ
jgi:hypothetical protein